MTDRISNIPENPWVRQRARHGPMRGGAAGPRRRHGAVVVAPAPRRRPGWRLLLIALASLLLVLFRSATPLQRLPPTAPADALTPRPALAATSAAAPRRRASPAPAGPTSDAPPAAEVAIAGSITAANQAFIRARLDADPAPLLAVARNNWLAAEREHIGALRAQGIKERWRMLRLTIGTISVGSDRATVCTSEDWERVLVDARGSATPPETQHWNERYTLLRDTAGWRVSDLEYLDAPCGG